MFGDELAVTDDGELIALVEPKAVGFDERDLGIVDALLFDARHKFVRCSFVFLNQLIPGGHFFVEPGDVLERIIRRHGPIEDAQELVEDLAVLGGFAGEAALSFGDLSIERGRLIVFTQPLQCEGAVELNDVAEPVAVLALVIVQANQCGLHDIDAGDVLWDRKPIRVFFGEPLKILDDVEQIAGGRIAWVGQAARRARRDKKKSESKQDRFEEGKYAADEWQNNSVWLIHRSIREEFQLFSENFTASQGKGR